MASPPPLQHPIPRAPFHPPEPPRTPANSSPATTEPYSPPAARLSYERFSSPPPVQQGQGGYMQGNAYFPQQQPQQPLGSMSTGSTSPYGHPPNPPLNNAPAAGWNPLGAMAHLAAGGGGGGGGARGGAGGGVMNDATAQMGLQFGSQVFGVGQNYVEQTFTRHLPMPLLKHSFAVSNGYVLRKLGVLVWPWRRKSWGRTVRRSPDGQPEGWASPREDLNAPDLYIPTMAIITYILLSALHSGLQARFHPEVLGLTASKALGVVLLEFMAIKLGTYLLDVKGGGAGAWEVGFYGGYKFVGVICCLLVDLLSPGRLVWWSVFVYVVAANAFFLLRSLKYILLPDPTQSFDSSPAALSATVTHAQRTTRVRFLVLVALGQVGLMGALVWV